MRNGIETSPELDGATPLELALDRATDQYMAAMHERRGRRRLASSTGATTSTALALEGQHSIVPARLSWRGIEVTEEFQEYAMRVARGEQLEPFRGQVLARHCDEFPLGVPSNETTGTEALPRLRPRAPRVVGWLLGTGALVMAALGIGTGASNQNASADELDAFGPATTTALSLRPAPVRVEEPETRIASAIESALAQTKPEPDPSARSHAPAPGLPAVAPALRTPSTPTRAAAVVTAQPPLAPATAASPIASNLANLVAHAPQVPSPPQVPNANGTSIPSARAPLASAAVGSAATADAATSSSALFSDSAPF